MFFLQEEDKIF